LARSRSPNRDKAFELFKENAGHITNREIANILNEDEKVIAVWKSRDKWNDKCNVVQQSKQSCTTKGKGGQSGNKNAVGHGAPAKNDNAVKHGLFEKYLPQETLDIVNNMSLNPLDILWDQIQIAYAAIVRAQQIMHVADRDDLTKELKRSKVKTSSRSTSKTDSETREEEYEYELQFAWDKQANFLKAQARAQSELRSMIKQYDELLHNNWDLATEEQKTRIEALRARAQLGDNGSVVDDGFIDALSGKVDEIWQKE
jgi:phage terminase small subunit